MFTLFEIKNLSVGDSLSKEEAGFAIKLTRHFFDGSSLENKLNVTITPTNSRSDDEWCKNVADAEAANNFIQQQIGYRLKAA